MGYESQRYQDGKSGKNSVDAAPSIFYTLIKYYMLRVMYGYNINYMNQGHFFYEWI